MSLNLAARPYLDTDHPTLAKWFTAQEWPTLPKEALPKTGYIVPGYCAGFLYKTDSSIAMLEWIIANPDTDYKDRAVAINNVIESLVKEAKRSGYSVVFTYTKHERLIDKYLNNNFKITDKDMTHFMRVL